MGTLFDYVAWRGDLTFSQAPFNEVDSLIFALLSYVEYKGVVSEAHDGETISLQAAANNFFARNPDPKKVSIGLIVPREIVQLLRVAKGSKRFRRVGMTGYVNQIDLDAQMQFSAVTFCLETGERVVAFRGTDDTIIGWKEDFNMSFMDVVPAQRRALEYLNEAAKVSDGNLYMTGHSKGGNLSVYAAMHADAAIKKRLVGVWNHDGPGFRDSVLNDPKYLEIKPQIKTLLPQSSLVGILLEHEEDYTVVKSRQVGFLQHNGLSWDVLGSSFVRVKDISAESKRADKTLKKWIESMTLEQREQLGEALYRILSSDNALTLTDLVSIKNRWILRGLQMDDDVAKVLKQTIPLLIKASISQKNK